MIKNAPLPGLEVRLTRDVQISVDLSFSSRVPGEALEDSGIAGLYLPDLKAHAGDDLVARVAEFTEGHSIFIPLQLGHGHPCELKTQHDGS